MSRSRHSPRLRLLTIAGSGLLASGLAGTAAGAHSTAPAVRGTWVSAGAPGRAVLVLAGSKSPYSGTYSQGGKSSRVLARSSTADGAAQLTLTFVATGRSTFCALHGGRLYCQLGPTGTTVFVHG